MPVEDVDVVLSLFVVALSHDVLPASTQIAVGQRLVVVGQVSFRVHVHQPKLQHYMHRSTTTHSNLSTNCNYRNGS